MMHYMVINEFTWEVIDHYKIPYPECAYPADEAKRLLAKDYPNQPRYKLWLRVGKQDGEDK